MMEGLLGIFLAFLIFILVLFFVKRKPDQKVALEIKNAMKSFGFINLEPSNPKIQEIREAFRLTAPYPVYLEQVFHRIKDDLIICGFSKSTESNDNSLVSLLTQKIRTSKWILFNLTSVKGKIGNIIKKGYELFLLSLNFTKVNNYFWGKSNKNFTLFINKNELVPFFINEFFNVLQQCGDVIIRSSETIILIERISATKDEPWEQEAKDLIRITQLLKDLF
jgi:hypothetical protein